MHPGRELSGRAADLSCEDDLYPGSAAPMGVRLPKQPSGTYYQAHNRDNQGSGQLDQIFRAHPVTLRLVARPKKGLAPNTGLGTPIVPARFRSGFRRPRPSRRSVLGWLSHNARTSGQMIRSNLPGRLTRQFLCPNCRILSNL